MGYFQEEPIDQELSWIDQSHQTCWQQKCVICPACIHESSPWQAQLPTITVRQTYISSVWVPKSSLETQVMIIII